MRGECENLLGRTAVKFKLGLFYIWKSLKVPQPIHYNLNGQSHINGKTYLNNKYIIFHVFFLFKMCGNILTICLKFFLFEFSSNSR